MLLRGHRPDVVVLDAQQLSAPSEIRELGALHTATRLVLLAKDPSAAECAQALAFGASAYLGSDTQARDLLNAIHLASRGLQVTPRMAPRGAQETIAGSRLLTARELQVLALLQQGRSNAEIALELHVGVETVRTHNRNIYRKLDVASRRELAPQPPAGPVSAIPARAQAPRPRQSARSSPRMREHRPLPRR